MKGVMGRMALVLLAAGGVLTGCASSQPTEQWATWTCDSQAKVLWRYAESDQRAVDVRLGGGDIVYRLKQEPVETGAFYSSDVLAFHIKGQEGLLYWVANNDLIGRGCKAH
jgi:membrane-bound inhibitor of C-type lysozyme